MFAETAVTDLGAPSSVRLLGGNRHRQALAALRPPALEDLLSARRAHALAEAVRPFATPVARLIGAFHARPSRVFARDGRSRLTGPLSSRHSATRCFTPPPPAQPGILITSSGPSQFTADRMCAT